MTLKSEPHQLHNIYSVERPDAALNVSDLAEEEPSLVDDSDDELQIAGLWGAAGRTAAGIVAPVVSGGNVPAGSALYKAFLRYQKKLAKQKDLATAVKNAGPDEKGRRLSELEIETKYDVIETDEGFQAVNVGRNEVIGTYTSREEAKKAILHEQSDVSDLGPAERWKRERRLSPEDEVPEQAVPEKADPVEGESLLPPTESAAKKAKQTPEREPVKDDRYKYWVSFDDEDLKIAAEGVHSHPEMKDGMIGNLRVKGKDGAVKIVDEGHVYGLIDSTSRALENNLNKLGEETVKRISNQETARLADLLGVNPNKLMNDLMGGRFEIGVRNPGHFAAIMHAAKSLLIAEIRKLDELSDVVLGKKGAYLVSDEARYAWVRQNELVANLKRHYLGARSDIARAQQINRLPVADDRLTAAEAEAMLSRNFTHNIDELGGPSAIDDAVRLYDELGDDVPARLAFGTQLTQFEKWTDAIHEVFVMNLLSGWFSHVKNTAGVIGVLVGDVVETSGAATLQVPAGLLGHQRAVTYGDVSAKVFGQLMSAREALIAGARAFWLREEPPGMEMTITAETKLNLGHQRRDAFSAAAMEYTGFWGTVVDYAGQLLTLGRLPTRMLMAEDAVMKVTAQKGALYEEAFRQARFKNLKGDAAAEFIAEFVFNPPEAAAAKARDWAKYVTLQSDISGTMKDLQRFARNRFVRLIMPFFKTPTNAVIYTGERSPAARIFKHYKDAEMAGGAEAAKANARAVLGTAIMAYIATEWDADTLTGNLSDNPGVLAAYRRMGKTRNSLRIGDYYYNYKWMEPWSTVPALVSSTMEIVSHPDIDDATAFEVMATVGGAIGQSITNNTFMSGVSMLLDVLQQPDRHGERFAYNYLRSAVPGSAALNEFRRATDPLRRLKRDYLDVIRDRLPGLSKDLFPERDLWGRVSMPNRWRSFYEPNVVDEEIIRLDLNFPKHHPTVVDGVSLKDEEIDWFHKRAGEMAKKALEALVDPKSKKAPLVGVGVGQAEWSAWRKEYATHKRASEMGDELATTYCENMLRGMLLEVQKDAVKELLTSSPFAAEIMKYKLAIEIKEQQIKVESQKDLIRSY